MAMAQNAMMSADQLWQSIRGEAETAVARDPMFGARLTHAILDHADLGSAVAHQIGERLGKSAEERAQFARLASEAQAAALDLVEAANLDLQSIAIHDPAVTSRCRRF
jgi:serine O-acetyltransferase